MENLHDKQSFYDHPRGAKVFELLTDCMDNGCKGAIPKGSDLYGKPISLERLEAEFAGRKQPLYVLVCTHGIYVVMVSEVDQEKQVLHCHFFNPDKTRHPDRSFRFGDILECYHVYRVGVYFVPREEWEDEAAETDVQPSTSK